jgi:hypothetical protein
MHLFASRVVPPARTEHCATSVGTGGAAQEAELLSCLGDITFDTGTCPWFSTPA